MPRTRRAWEPGDILSIVGRAHEGRPIFISDEDRAFLTDRMRRVFVPPDADLLAWAVLSNHYHLVIRVRDASPGTLFRRFNTVVAQRERRRRGDHGAVFQDRFWSRPCSGEGGALHLLTYVLGNPVHHAVVATATQLEIYRWTAYPEVLGLATPGIVDAAATLALVHPDAAVARATLRDAMAARIAGWQAERAGTDRCDEPGCTGVREGCQLVHVAQRRSVPATPAANASSVQRPTAGVSVVHDTCRDRRRRFLAAGRSPVELVARVCAPLGADADAVLRGVRTHPESRARAVVAFVACDGLGLPAGDVAALLGVTGSATCSARRRGRAVAAARGWVIDDLLSTLTPLA